MTLNAVYDPELDLEFLGGLQFPLWKCPADFLQLPKFTDGQAVVM